MNFSSEKTQDTPEETSLDQTSCKLTTNTPALTSTLPAPSQVSDLAIPVTPVTHISSAASYGHTPGGSETTEPYNSTFCGVRVLKKDMTACEVQVILSGL